MNGIVRAALVLFCPVLPILGPPLLARADCFDDVAATRGYTLGLPRHVVPLPDGHALYLRSGPRDTRQRLLEFDPATGAERVLVLPETLLGGEPETLTPEERARRERARTTVAGITDFAVSRDGGRVLVPLGDRLFVVERASGAVTALPGAGWIAPRLSPAGDAVLAVRDDDLHVIEIATGRERALTQGGGEALTRGVPDFAAAEEFDRDDGAWWSPDGRTVAYEEADLSRVERRFIADPLHPEQPPVAFRYPRAGTENASIRVGLVPRAGGRTVWLEWDHATYPYLARLVWPERGRLSLVVLDRAQTHEAVLAADPVSGATTALLTETDPAWVEAGPRTGRARAEAGALPHWLPDGGGFLWATEAGGTWRLDLHGADGAFMRTVTPPSHPFVSLDDVGPDGIVFSASPDRLSVGVWRIAPAGGEPVAVADAPGLHSAAYAVNHMAWTDDTALADGTRGVVLHADSGGTERAVTLPSVAEAPPALPRVTFGTAGERALDRFVVLPRDFHSEQKYPVILSVYAGPGVKTVGRSPRNYFAQQCMADAGAIVVGIDGRGTPGRDHDFARAIKGDFIGAPLADQVDGLRALAATTPGMDPRRVGVTGWSFGGYFTAMAVLRRPDVFTAGVAGAPVVDWADYDTAYTERYLGTPEDAPEAYRVSGVLTDAATLSRKLLLIHGLTDDNVYFEHTVKLTQALLRAGKPYDLMLLTGTHLLPDASVRAAVERARTNYLLENLR